jgi:uncharacterized protein (TIGR00251 family)
VSARLEVVVRPRARRSRVEGFRGDGKLVVAVAAPPEDGRANEAVAEVLGESLGVRARDVTIVRGQRSRAKLIEVQGIDEAELQRRIERALGGSGGKHGD